MEPEPIIRQPMDDTLPVRKKTLARRIWIALIILYVAGLHAVVGLVLVKTDLADRVLRRFSESTPAPVLPPVVAQNPVASAIVETVTPPSPARNFDKELKAILDRDLFIYPLYTHFALKNLLPNDPLFLVGDSMIRGLDVQAIAPTAVNFGLSGDNTAGVLYRIKTYPKVIPSFATAKSLVLAVGINNLGIGASADYLIPKHISLMLSQRPTEQHVVLNGIFPVDEAINPLEFAGYNKRISVINRKLESVCNAFPNCTFLNAGKIMVSRYGNLTSRYHKKNDAVHLSPEAYAIWVKELRNSLNLIPNESQKEQVEAAPPGEDRSLSNAQNSNRITSIDQPTH